MPWRPPAEDRPPRDERVEACRDRAARLSDSDGREALLYCRVATAWTQTDGHLWWRRWSAPYYVLEGYWLEEGAPNDFLSSGEDLAAMLSDFERGVFGYVGDQWRVQWLDEEGSQAVREEYGFEVYRP